MRRWLIIAAALAVFITSLLLTESRWDGDATESAAAPLAEQAGVEEAQVLPWKIEGDLLLFVFLAGGAGAGFAAGYFWRKLFSETNGRRDDHG